MKNRLSVVAIALSTLVAGHALAADPSVAKTREQVRAELVEAQRNGTVLVDGDQGLRAYPVTPRPAAQKTAEKAAEKAVVVGKTREDVLQELRDARANGTLIANSETGETYRDIDPRSYPAADVAQGKTRAQVLAELAEARRTGDLIANSETGAKYNEIYPGRYPTRGTVQAVNPVGDVRAGAASSKAAVTN